MEEFITFEIAKKLKEKGFREECLAYYTTDDKYLQVIDIDYKEFLVSHNSIKYPNNNYVDAPTISQVLDWLREEKKYHIEINYNESYGYNIIRITDSEYKGGGREFKSFREVALAGIEYVLDTLI